MAPYFGMTGGWLAFWVTVACATDMTLFGYDQGVFGGVIVTEDFLNTLNLNGKTSLIGTVTAIYDIGCFVGAIAAVIIGDLLGRKKTILFGTTIMTVGAIIQISAFNVPTMMVGRWLYLTETNSLSMRTKGAALGTAANWIFNFMVVEITPIGIETLGWRFYIIWTAFNASFVPIVYLFYPETSDRTLEDIDRLFRENGDIFIFKDKNAIPAKRLLAYFEREIMDGTLDAGAPSSQDIVRLGKQRLTHLEDEMDSWSGPKAMRLFHPFSFYSNSIIYKIILFPVMVIASLAIKPAVLIEYLHFINFQIQPTVTLSTRPPVTRAKMQFSLSLISVFLAASSVIASPMPAKKSATSTTSAATAKSTTATAATGGNVLTSQTYNAISISGGTAGNAKAEADALFSAIDTNNLAAVSAADLKIIKNTHDVAENAEVQAFNPVIAAASGTTATDLQNGKIKNKVLKLTATVLSLQIQAAQGTDTSAKLTAEQTKLDKNIALDTAAAGQTATAVQFDGTT
ncbi:hypothetical protein G7Y89_g1102 [Cudoniella acicularis]|uniref:Major facilitator superfamily (MFS) profile domain-containing protein n=1 Tax=Cudoniella acicularis TaxID=354080 RepID=A0A8H4RVW7_9HELO|nr:hypothetical protein G7Y89_g1102 [Cudoniella acicularis]